MVDGISRRRLLRGGAGSDDPSAIRPPGADPANFARLCEDCDLCAKACPEEIITIDDAGRARLDFTRGACTFCGVCADICPTGALTRSRLAHWPWRAVIARSCLSWSGVTCRLCEDACAARAIGFRLIARGRAEPVVDRAACTGCGACAGVCPVGAATLDRGQVQPAEAAA